MSWEPPPQPPSGPPQPPSGPPWPPGPPSGQQPPPWQQQGQPWQQPPPPQQGAAWQQPPQGPGWQQGATPRAPAGSDGFAKTALVLGVLPMCGGFLGVVFGIIALARIRRTGAGGRGMAITGIVGGIIWLLVTVLVLAFAIAHPTRDHNGRVTSAQTLDIKELKIGDCVAERPTSPVTTVKVEPCTRGHVGEIYDVSTMSGSSYPGNAAVDSYTTERCRRLLPLYLSATPGQSGYDIYYVAPSQESWDGGRKIVVCLLLGKSGELTGSAKGTGPAPN